MEVRSYNQELEYANMLFKRPFSNIEIQRNGQTRKVNCVIGSRSRILKNLENPDRAAMYQLPLIIIQRTGIQKNDDRLANVWNEVKYRQNSRKLNYDIFTPVPIDITYTVTIVSKYLSDISMILSNFIPFFNKDSATNCIHPKFGDVPFTNQIIMDNSIQEETLDEMDGTQDDISTATCTFTYKTFLFCGNNKPRRVVKTEVSGYISSYTYQGLSDCIYELSEEEMENVEEFLQKHPKCRLSANVPTQVDMEISTYVSTLVSTETSVIEGFIPQANAINVGFYAVPLQEEHQTYMEYVDSLSARGYDDRPYADRFVMKLNEDGEIYSVDSLYPSGDWWYTDVNPPNLRFRDPKYPTVDPDPNVDPLL